MNIDRDWVATGALAVLGGGLLVSHILSDRARYREMRRESEKFQTLRDEVRKFVDEAREKLQK